MLLLIYKDVRIYLTWTCRRSVQVRLAVLTLSRLYDLRFVYNDVLD